MNTAIEMSLRLQKRDSGLSPSTRTINVDDVFRNANNTGDDEPKVGRSWKEYWQIFSLEDFPSTCPFCGKPLAEDEVSGCHINLRRVRLYPKDGEDKYYYSEKEYIIPGHQRCNKCAENENEFKAKTTITAVEVVEK